MNDNVVPLIPMRYLEESYAWTTMRYGLYYADDYDNAIQIYRQLQTPQNDYRLKMNRCKNYEWYFDYYGSNNFAIVYPEKHTYVLKSPDIYGDTYVYSIPFNHSSARTFNIRVNTPNVRMFVKMGWTYWDPYNIQIDSCEKYRTYVSGRGKYNWSCSNIFFRFCTKEPLSKVEIEFNNIMPSERLGKFIRNSTTTCSITHRPGYKYYTSNELHQDVFNNTEFVVIPKPALPIDIKYLF